MFVPNITVVPEAALGYVIVTINYSADPTILFAKVTRTLPDGTSTVVRPHTFTNSTGDYIELSAGVAVLYDTEAPFNTVLTYSTQGFVSTVSSSVIPTFIGRGALSAADNAAVTPATTGFGAADGDLLLCAGRMYGTAGSLSTVSAGWTLMAQINNLYLWAAVRSGATAITVTPAGGAAGDTVAATVFAMRDMPIDGIVLIDLIKQIATQSNASAQNVAYPGLSISTSNRFVLLVAGKSDDWTSVAVPSGFTEIGEPSTGTGNDEAIYLAIQIQTTATNVASGSLVVTGGASAVSESMMLALEAFAIPSATAGPVTLTNTFPWLKSPLHPWANKQLVLTPNSYNEVACIAGDSIIFASMAEETHPGKSTAHTPFNAKFPVPSSRLRGSIVSSLRLITRTFTARNSVIELNASGDPLLFQAPTAYGIPDRYMTVSDLAITRFSADHKKQWRANIMPHVEIDVPAGLADGVLGVRWADICDLYSTFADFEAAGITRTQILFGQAASPPSPTVCNYNDLAAAYVDYNAMTAANADYSALLDC